MTTHITRMACAWNMGTRVGINSGSTGEWGNSSGTVDQVALAARTGPYGLRIHPTGALAFQTRVFNLSQVFVDRFYFQFPTLPSADAHVFYIGAGGGTERDGFQLRFITSDDTVRFVELDNLSAVIETSTGPVISAGQWYRVDVRFKGSSTASPGLDWQIAEDDEAGVAQTSLTGSYALNRVFFGSNVAQTFDLYIADQYGAYSTDDAGENGAALAAEYPRGPGYGKRLVATSTSFGDSADFSMTDASAVTNAWQAMDDDPLIGAPGLRQDVVDTTNYAEFGLTQLDAGEVPYAISVVAEARAVAGGTSNASLRITKDAAEQTIITQNWNNGPQLISVVYLPGDSQTTKWTRAQVNAARVRWGYSSNVSNPPIIGGFVVTVDVSLAEELEAYWGVALQ